MKRLSIIIGSLLIYIASVSAQAIPSKIEFNDEKSDTTRLTKILIGADTQSNRTKGAQSYVLQMAEQFIGTPYKEGTLEGDEERLRINLDGMDCTTFVETAMALALSAAEKRSSWRDFAFNLERLRYRGGTMKGYASRLHYISDWALDNSNLGLVTEVTDRIGRSDRMIKSLDWITSHRDDYPALKDSATYAAMKHVESGFHGHRLLYIKSTMTGGAQLADGDIIGFVTKKDGLDVSHMGIIKMMNGKPHLIHASSAAGKVVMEDKPLADYLRRRRDIAGIRVFRMSNN